MYIPSSLPLTISELFEFLQPSIADGLFDSIGYDDDTTPTKIICTQNNNVILEISSTNNGHGWVFTPYVSTGVAAAAYGINVLQYLCRCKGGIYFMSTNAGSPTFNSNFIIAKTNNGKTGFIQFNSQRLVDTMAPISFKIYSRQFGDDTTLTLYTGGYTMTSNCYGSNVVADRTILTCIPVIGNRGSADYFTTAFVRSAFQFMEDGQQKIGEKIYGCIDKIAILDE